MLWQVSCKIGLGLQNIYSFAFYKKECTENIFRMLFSMAKNIGYFSRFVDYLDIYFLYVQQFLCALNN